MDTSTAVGGARRCRTGLGDWAVPIVSEDFGEHCIVVDVDVELGEDAEAIGAASETRVGDLIELIPGGANTKALGCIGISLQVVERDGSAKLLLLLPTALFSSECTTRDDDFLASLLTSSGVLPCIGERGTCIIDRTGEGARTNLCPRTCGPPDEPALLSICSRLSTGPFAFPAGALFVLFGALIVRRGVRGAIMVTSPRLSSLLSRSTKDQDQRHF
jgi:hypothetical protein